MLQLRRRRARERAACSNDARRTDGRTGICVVRCGGVAKRQETVGSSYKTSGGEGEREERVLTQGPFLAKRNTRIARNTNCLRTLRCVRCVHCVWLQNTLLVRGILSAAVMEHTIR